MSQRIVLIGAGSAQFGLGTLTDLFNSKPLRGSTIVLHDINPTALVCLRLTLEGEVHSTAVAVGDGHRVLAPFPVRIQDGTAHIQGRKGLKYQILVDGTKIVDVESQGVDSLTLGPGR